MTYDGLVGCPANGYGDGALDPRPYNGPLFECVADHERVTWRGSSSCWVCEEPGHLVGYTLE